MSNMQNGHLEALWICGQCFHISSKQLYLLAIVDIEMSVIAHYCLSPCSYFVYKNALSMVEVIRRLFYFSFSVVLLS
jgi:hypothetical protein